jgi:hypothetical protein
MLQQKRLETAKQRAKTWKEAMSSVNRASVAKLDADTYVAPCYDGNP